MQAIKLSKKYPEFKQDEIFDLINKFKWVPVGHEPSGWAVLDPGHFHHHNADRTQAD
jgi:hypothetical protein